MIKRKQKLVKHLKLLMFTMKKARQEGAAPAVFSNGHIHSACVTANCHLCTTYFQMTSRMSVSTRCLPHSAAISINVAKV